jgi:murein DD-endopeptidase MepM/ murein hydrolase activator NlpD
VALRRLRLLAALAVLLLPIRFPLDLRYQAASIVPLPSLPLPPLPPARTVQSSLKVMSGTIVRHATLEKVLGTNLDPTRIHYLVQTARPLYNLAQLSVGHPFNLTLGPDGVLAAFSYGIDELRTLRVKRNGDGLEAHVEKRTYETRTETVAGEINSSLFGAVEGAGESDQLAFDLAAIFEWDVDFNTELRPGDSFKVAVEKMYLEGRFSRYGHILGAQLDRGNRVLRAVRFDGPRGPEYYTPAGVPLRKTFLRSPLKFARISSPFSHARLHPILKTVRPHLGVDFAAPTGTPVRAAANGVVVSAGRSGGYGKVVRLRHPRGMETLYGHLSRIDVKRGQRVKQGERIGAVGMTGLATGPHLDYRTIRNGVFVNPLKIQPPPAEPVPASSRVAFEAERDRELALLEPAAPTPILVTAPMAVAIVPAPSR